MDKRLLSRGAAQNSHLSALQRASQMIRHWGYTLDLYNWRLTGRHPLKVDRTIDDLRGADRAAGDQMLIALKAAGDPKKAAATYWAGRIKDYPADQTFSFIRDLAGAGETARALGYIEALVSHWCDISLAWEQKSWQAQAIAWRLVNWLVAIKQILASQDLVYRSRVLLAIARQMRHLPRVVRDIANPVDQAAAGAALALAGLLLPDGSVQRDKGFRLMGQVASGFVLADGVPRSRFLGDALSLMLLFTLVRRAAQKADVLLPDTVQRAIDRLGPFLGAVHLSDGALTGLYGGATRQSGVDGLSDLFEAAGVQGSPGYSFPHGGLQRLASSGSVALIDTGPVIKGSRSRLAPLSTGALEFSAGSERIFVSMGASSRDDLVDLCRTTAAFSAAVIDNRNNTELTRDGLAGAGVTLTETIRRAQRGGDEITLLHDGYTKRLKVKLTRVIKLSKDGLVLEGRDFSVGTAGALPKLPFDVRFHLHPDLDVHRARDGEIILITKSKKVWVFECSGDMPEVTVSLYNLDPMTPVGSKAIQVSRPVLADIKNPVSWSLTRRE